MRLTLLAAVGLAAAPLVAQTPAALPGAPEVGRVVAGTYQLDGAHSQVLFTVNHLGFTEYSGQFIQPTGSLTIDPAHPQAAKVDITFPIDKVSTTEAALDEHLKKPEFFDAAKYPTGHFVSTEIKVEGMRATITGDLTLRGVTKPVTLQARFVGAGNNPLSKKLNIGFRATTSIMRSQFGINYGIPIVSDKVDLAINAAFIQG